jgi:hypothetical protein
MGCWFVSCLQAPYSNSNVNEEEGNIYRKRNTCMLVSFVGTLLENRRKSTDLST